MEELEISSFRELAKRAGVSNGTINAQKNQLKAPTIETAEGLCRALQVSWVELWTQAGYVPNMDKNQLSSLDAEIYQALQGTGDDFKSAVLKTIKTWLILYEELRK